MAPSGHCAQRRAPFWCTRRAPLVHSAVHDRPTYTLVLLSPLQSPPHTPSLTVSRFCDRPAPMRILFDRRRGRRGIAVLPAVAVALVVLLAPAVLAAQDSCVNYAQVSGDSCVCPAGFTETGSNACDLPQCGGSLYMPGTVATGTFGNVTNCACSDGWTGPSCTGGLWTGCTLWWEGVVLADHVSVQVVGRMLGLDPKLPQLVDRACQQRPQHQHDVLERPDSVRGKPHVLCCQRAPPPNPVPGHVDIDHLALPECVPYTRRHHGPAASRHRWR